MILSYEFKILDKWQTVSKWEAIDNLLGYFGYKGCGFIPGEVSGLIGEAEANLGKIFKLGTWDKFRVVSRHQGERISQ